MKRTRVSPLLQIEKLGSVKKTILFLYQIIESLVLSWHFLLRGLVSSKMKKKNHPAIFLTLVTSAGNPWDQTQTSSCTGWKYYNAQNDPFVSLNWESSFI